MSLKQIGWIGASKGYNKLPLYEAPGLMLDLRRLVGQIGQTAEDSASASERFREAYEEAYPVDTDPPYLYECYWDTIVQMALLVNALPELTYSKNQLLQLLEDYGTAYGEEMCEIALEEGGIGSSI